MPGIPQSTRCVVLVALFLAPLHGHEGRSADAIHDTGDAGPPAEDAGKESPRDTHD